MGGVNLYAPSNGWEMGGTTHRWQQHIYHIRKQSMIEVLKGSSTLRVRLLPRETPKKSNKSDWSSTRKKVCSSRTGSDSSSAYIVISRSLEDPATPLAENHLSSSRGDLDIVITCYTAVRIFWCAFVGRGLICCESTIRHKDHQVLYF
jgi:hypothetical protein